MPNHVVDMYRNVGMNYVETILMPVVEGNIKDVIGKWNAQDLVANRAIATAEILKKLKEQMEKIILMLLVFKL